MIEKAYSSVYNSLPSVEESHSLFVDRARHLSALGCMFVRHKVHDRLGICLLHNHYGISDDEVVLQEGLVTSPYKDCKIEECNPTTIKLFGKNDTHGLEFSKKTDAVNIAEEFLEDLYAYLSSNNLDDILGLTVRDKKGAYYLEHTEGRNNILTEITREEAQKPGSNIQTNWLFDSSPEDRCASGSVCQITTSCSTLCVSNAGKAHKKSNHEQRIGPHRATHIPHRRT